MNRRIAITAALATLALAGTTALAGPGGERGRPNPERMLERMTEHLDLDASQVASIEAIMADAEQMRLAIGDKYTLNERDAAREEFKALREQTEGQISAVLTDEQREKFEAAKERMRERAEMRRFHRRAHAEDDNI